MNKAVFVALTTFGVLYAGTWVCHILVGLLIVAIVIILAERLIALWTRVGRLGGKPPGQKAKKSGPKYRFNRPIF